MNSTLPCLYMLWPPARRQVDDQTVSAGYTLRTYRDNDETALLALLGSDGEIMNEGHWQDYRDRLLPNGLFVVEHSAAERIVATAGAVHNPNPGRYYFPYGSELGYLIVAPEHRRHRLGTAVCVAVVQRLLAAGYESIRVCVQEHRVPAIKTYLGIGFEPFLHSTEVEQRWQRVYAALKVC